MKHSGLAVVEGLGLIAAARTLQSGRSVVLTYHGILSGDDDRYDYLNHNFISEAMFDRQLHYLRRYYRLIPLSRLVDCYQRGVPPPPRSVAITFDDGFANNYTVAFPLLQRHGVPFTVFLATGLIGEADSQLWTERVKRAIYLHPRPTVSLEVAGHRLQYALTSAAARAAAARRVLLLLKREPPAARNRAVASIEAVCGRPPLQPVEHERYAFLDWSQVRAMAATGVEFGSHSVSHPILSTLDERSLEIELKASKERIESELGTRCDTFAYPNGSLADFGSREKQELCRAGYRAAFSLNAGLNGRRPDLFEIDRINVGRHLDLRTFRAATSGILGTARRLRARVLAAARVGEARGIAP